MILGFLILAAMTGAELPAGSAPPPVPAPHFPDRLHAFVWRNWQLVPAERMAETVGAKPEEILQIGRAMGLGGPPEITPDQQMRSYISVIKRNWHLLPYDQLLKLLGWTPDQMDYALREDDFLFIKLGRLKPKCEPLHYAPPDEKTRAREAEIARIVRAEFPEGVGLVKDPLFGFVRRLSAPPEKRSEATPLAENHFSPRYCYSYFALYGDPLLDEKSDPYPEGYLDRIAAAGANGVWLQGVLYKLAPFPWDQGVSENYEQRLENLRKLAARAEKRGIGIYLYLNEPRTMPLKFFETRPQLKGISEFDQATLCTSVPEVQNYIRDSVESLCRAVPNLAGIFTITASENLTSCWSHGAGAKCPRCGKRDAADVISEVNNLIHEGIARAGTKTRLIAWDWGWQDPWIEPIISKLPADAALMSVSEWSIPINRGGVESVIGEYSISEVGPGPRATRNWELARKRGMKAMAKIQTGTTWELGAVPYVPAVENVARHALNLRRANVDGLMLGWTLGGYPSPNLDAVTAAGRAPDDASPDDILRAVALDRFGEKIAPTVVQSWKEFSAAFHEFPYHVGTVYSGPMHNGPANPLWERPTGYVGTMVGFPYDDLDQWRAVYPPDVFAAQFEKMSEGMLHCVNSLRVLEDQLKSKGGVADEELDQLAAEADVTEACQLHFKSSADQSRFVLLRRELERASGPEREEVLQKIEAVLRDEVESAKRLFAIQSRDSRIGFEATNHYFYVPMDLAEKVINCHDLLERWMPEERRGK